MKSKLVVAALILALASSTADCEQNGVGEWQILTEQNFSSQIGLHPHILLIVTFPWSGESRSLTKEVSQLVTDRQEEFNSLKLMIIHRNTETMLADAIGATEKTTVLYYHHSVSYKYRGKLRARNILYSIYPYMSVLPEELPLKSLSSPEALKAFLESTDKALILFEFCGWTPKLLAKEKNNVTETGIRLQGNHFGKSFLREMDGTQISRGNDNEKVAGGENGKMKCDAADGFSGIPWLGEFSLVNDSDPLPKTENMTSGVELSCKFEEFQQFDSFFSKFMSVARDFFLPPERHQFGLVSDRLLLQYLGIGDSDSWLAMLYLAGCPSCSKILKEENDLKDILQTNNEIVSELDGNGEGLDTVLPANKPSILLFVDRYSDSSETGRKSKEALASFRELALHHLISYQVSQKKNDWPGKLSFQSSQVLTSTSGHPKLKLSSTAKQIKFKDKMSIMVINEGKPITLDNIAPELQGNSLHEMLEYLLQKKKQAKLSSLAKDVGFHLLSEDFEVKVADISPSQTEIQSSEALPPKEGLVAAVGHPDKDQLPHGISQPAVEHEEKSKTANFQPSFHGEGKTISVDAKKQLISEEHVQHLPDHDLAGDKGVKVEESSSFEAYNSREEQHYFQSFSGSFLFSDGNYRLLRALTGGSTIPSLALIDPTSQQHYVFPEEKIFSYSSLADFLHGFLNGSLIPYQQSDESILQSSRVATQPPFVNRDFHEVDSIPQLTTRTFSELVVCLNQSENENAFHACNEDVLVLFSGGWCGFCQRMELVVREVYRSIKGYMKMLESGYRNGKTDLSGDNLKKDTFKCPQIYLMDCTLNDCSSILMSLTQNMQREVYPALMLFPAEKKDAIPYEGDIAVSDIIKFIADNGNNLHHLIGENGILWTVGEKGASHQKLFEGSSPNAGHEEASVSKESFREVILKSGTPKRTYKKGQLKSHESKGSRKTAHHLGVGSVLIAADTLLNVQPFDNSKILLVKADRDIGFEGLIVNKHISWDYLQKLEEGLEFLKLAPLSLGGPVMKREMPFVSLTRNVTKSGYPEVLPGIYFLDQSATVNEIKELKSGNHSISDHWFFLGYSSWGWDQLFNELAGGAWSICNNSMAQFDWPRS